MNQIDLTPQATFVTAAVDSKEWVNWKEIAEIFPQYEENYLGAMYKPMITFSTIPAAPDEDFNSGLIAVVRLATGYQEVVMSRPLPHNLQNYNLVEGFTRAVDMILKAVGDFHAVSVYLKK